MAVGDRADTGVVQAIIDAGTIAMHTMVIEAADVEATTEATTGEVTVVAVTVEETPDHVVTGKITTSIVMNHSVQGSPIPATGRHGQSDTPVIPNR